MQMDNPSRCGADGWSAKGTVFRSAPPLLRRLQPTQRDEERVRFGQRFQFELIAVEEAVFLAVEAMQVAAVAQ